MSLADWLIKCRDEKKSYERIHYELWNEFDIPASLPTVVRWINKYVI